jgi:hypothetical protein
VQQLKKRERNECDDIEQQSARVMGAQCSTLIDHDQLKRDEP